MGRDDAKKQKEKVDEGEKVEKVDKERQEWENKYKRALADYQNLEKRVLEERKNWIALANKELLLRLLPVLDTLILASGHVKDQSLQVSLQQFLDVLKNEGVEKIETIGQDFDPRTMECIATVEGEEGKVLEEIRTGFMLEDKVLRPAQVMVGKGKI